MDLSQSNAQLQIFVKTPTGKAIQISIDPSTTTCPDLKKMITAALVDLKLPTFQPSKQILSFSGIVLDDSKKLLDYNIHQDSTIHVVLKPLPKDILRFDECKFCHCSAVDPVVLPCGHTCCTFCVPFEAKFCPVDGCEAPLDGLTRDTLPKNWVVEQFDDPMPEEENKPKTCQVCSENGVEREATHWCQACSTTSAFQFYCTECDTAEHSTRSARDHARVPADQNIGEFVFSICEKHKLSECYYCWEESMFVCPRCCQDEHADHLTDLVFEWESKRKTELRRMISAVPDLILCSFDKQEGILKQQRQVKQNHLEEMEQKVLDMKEEISGINNQIDTVHENRAKGKLAALVLMQAVKGYPVPDLFNDRPRLLEQRISDTLLLFTKDRQAFPVCPPRPSFKARYALKKVIEHEKMIYPYGIAIDGSGTVFVSDKKSHQIQVFQRDVWLRSFGEKGDNPGQFKKPVGIAFDIDNNLIVVEEENNRAQIVDPQDGRCLAFLEPRRLTNPDSVAVDSVGKIFVTDSGNNRVQVFNPAGVWLQSIGAIGDALGQLNCPTGIALDSQGNILVVEQGNQRIQVFTNAGEPLRVFGTKREGRWGIVVAKDEKIAVVDALSVKLFSPEGQFMTLNEKGWHPVGITVDKNNNFIVCSGGPRIPGKLFIFE